MVDYKNDDRAPLLFISGTNDHIMPPSVQRSNAKHYKSEKAFTEIVEYEGPHFMPALEGWEKIADYALEWAVAARRAAPCEAGAMPFITTPDGVELFYKDWGPRSGRTVVLSHGWPLSSTPGRRSSCTSPRTGSARSPTTAAGTAAPRRCGTATTWTTTPTTWRR